MMISARSICEAAKPVSRVPTYLLYSLNLVSGAIFAFYEKMNSRFEWSTGGIKERSKEAKLLW